VEARLLPGLEGRDPVETAGAGRRAVACPQLDAGRVDVAEEEARSQGGPKGRVLKNVPRVDRLRAGRCAVARPQRGLNRVGVDGDREEKPVTDDSALLRKAPVEAVQDGGPCLGAVGLDKGLAGSRRDEVERSTDLRCPV